MTTGLRGIAQSVASRIGSISGNGWTAIITLVGVVIALGGVWFTYSQAENQARNAAVLKLQERWASPEMQARHARIVDGLLCKYTQARACYSDENQAVEETLLPSHDYVGQETDLVPYVEFFSEVKACVRTGLCNEKAACNLFGGNAKALQIHFGPTLRRQRLLLGASEWGREFGDFAKMCEGVSNPDDAMVEPPRQTLDELYDDYRAKGVTWQASEAACARMRPAPENGKSGPSTPKADPDECSAEGDGDGPASADIQAR